MMRAKDDKRQEEKEDKVKIVCISFYFSFIPFQFVCI